MTTVVGLVLRPTGGEAIDMFRAIRRAYPELRFLAEAEGHHALVPILDGVEPVDADTLERESQLVLVLGGDGTFIHAASLFRNRIVPILGVNMGHIGFLTEVSREEVLDVLPHALEGKLAYADRMRLDAEVRRNDTTVIRRRILNDAVLSIKALARIATYRITHDKELVTSLRGDGVIVSTPTGSTAYALAAGGSILSPRLEAMAITPVCPHQLTQRPLVVRAHGELTVRLDSDSNVFATLDGQAGCEFGRDDVLVVSRAAVPTRVLRVPWRNFFQTLRTKLNWGGD